ncbi:PaaX family transcriptional regulator C-terminal domain-containing protein [soil metagenome]
MMTRRPQDLVFTLYGEFLLKRGPVWVGSLLELLAPLGLSAGGARTVLSRMTAKGWLTSRRSGRRGYYALSARGRRLLEEGETRIYRPPELADWDGEWTLLAYSIPEELRPRRDRLRTRLSWLGFGSLGNGLWISPYAVESRVREIAEELGLGAHLELFRARHRGFSTHEQLVRQCWDLPALNVRYEAFVARHLPIYYRLKDEAAPVSPEAAYVRRFDLVHEYREFPLLDPFLPRVLHPHDWAGECAQALFQATHALLAAPSAAYIDSRVETLPASRSRRTR